MARIVLGFFIGIIFSVALWWAMPVVTDSVNRRDRKLDRAFHSITINMSRADVGRLMGSEGKVSSVFRLAQSAGYEFEYAAAAKSGAVYFVTWKNGIDWIYCVGFDPADRAIYKAEGGT